MNVGLVAHDQRKNDLIEWVKYNTLILSDHHLICTGTTGTLVEKEVTSLRNKITKLKSGPLGGDQEMGAKITGDEIDLLPEELTDQAEQIDQVEEETAEEQDTEVS